MKMTKEEFKKNIEENLKVLFRRSVADASEQQLFQAVAFAVKDIIMDLW